MIHDAVKDTEVLKNRNQNDLKVSCVAMFDNGKYQLDNKVRKNSISYSNSSDSSSSSGSINI